MIMVRNTLQQDLDMRKIKQLPTLQKAKCRPSTINLRFMVSEVDFSFIPYILLLKMRMVAEG